MKYEERPHKQWPWGKAAYLAARSLVCSAARLLPELEKTVIMIKIIKLIIMMLTAMVTARWPFWNEHTHLIIKPFLTTRPKHSVSFATTRVPDHQSEWGELFDISSLERLKGIAKVRLKTSFVNPPIAKKWCSASTQDSLQFGLNNKKSYIFNASWRDLTSL